MIYLFEGGKAGGVQAEQDHGQDFWVGVYYGVLFVGVRGAHEDFAVVGEHCCEHGFVVFY